MRAGGKLRIRNNSDPMEGGPHTFTLVRKSALPDSPAEQRNCFEGGICLSIGVAHQLDEEGNVGQPLVRVGRPGWNRSFAGKRKGDS